MSEVCPYCDKCFESSHKERIAELEADAWPMQKEYIAELEDEVARLKDPNWKDYIALTKTWLEKYPPDIFTGESGDKGPLFVVALREAVKELEAGDE